MHLKTRAARRRSFATMLATTAAVLVASSATVAQSPPRIGPARSPPPATTQSSEDDLVDVVEVGGAVRSLPRVLFVPADAASVPMTKELARLVALPGIYATATLAPGASTAGLFVRVVANGNHIEATSTSADQKTHRRMIDLGPSTRAVDLAREADAIVEDLSGTRTHLSGEVLYVDASQPGERRLRVMLGTGEPLRDVSPPGFLARGAGIGPGGVVYYAGGKAGEMLQIYREGQTTPVAVKVPGFLQSVAFTPDGLQAAVVAGNQEGAALFVGHLEGILRRVETGPGIAIDPAFGPNGELAFAAGPPEGPLRVFVDGKPVSPEGTWASAPSFCPKNGTVRVAFMVRAGATWTTEIADIGGGIHAVGVGSHPACSADGRSLAVGRAKAGRSAGGVWLIGEDGIAAHRIHEGEVAGLRWAPGPPLPPEG